MMRALAEFIMRGRAQAAVVAMIGSWFPLISPATVALVSLRRGAQEGTLVFIWAILPALAAMFASDMQPLMVMLSVLSCGAVLAAALILRRSISWPHTLMGIVAVSALAALLISTQVSGLVEMLNAAMAEMTLEASPQGQVGYQWTQTSVLGIIAYVIALSSVLALLLGRWWQALLFNPGGFKEEFHQLRLNRVHALVCVAASLYCASRGLDYHFWTLLFALPLLISGIALVHSVVALKNWPGQVLFVFYASLVIYPPWVIALAIVDVWINFRARLATSGDSGEQN